MLLDTHVLIWALMQPDALSGKARNALSEADSRCVSAASLYEIGLKGSLGKWPEVAGLVSADLAQMLIGDGFDILSASGAIMHFAGGMDWDHRDPFDRIIVATALECSLPLVSKDKTLDTYPHSGLRRIW